MKPSVSATVQELSEVREKVVWTYGKLEASALSTVDGIAKVEWMKTYAHMPYPIFLDRETFN
jgi:hypothetical protein